MLPRSQRVRLTADIQRVYTQGVRAHHSLLRLSALKTDAKHSRATVVVSKRVHLHATVRNRIKRRVRAALRPLLPQVKMPHDLVIVAQSKAVDASQSDLAKALVHLLNKAHLL